MRSNGVGLAALRPGSARDLLLVRCGPDTPPAGKLDAAPAARATARLASRGNGAGTLLKQQSEGRLVEDRDPELDRLVVLGARVIA